MIVSKVQVLLDKLTITVTKSIESGQRLLSSGQHKFSYLPIWELIPVIDGEKCSHLEVSQEESTHFFIVNSKLVKAYRHCHYG